MTDDASTPPIPGLVIRPPGPFLDLPLRWSWEATRRHTYYLHCWDWALRCHTRLRDIPPAEQAVAELSLAVLQAIDVSGPPVDPGTRFEELLGPDVDPAFLSGSCLPIPLRDLVSELIQQLTVAELMLLGHLCRSATERDYAIAGDDERLSRQRLQALLRLDSLVSPGLDAYGTRPLFRINPGAAEKTVLSDVTEQLRRFRRHFGLSDRRIHTAKFTDYFAVWDLREGWTGAGYDPAAEQEFLAIAAIRRKPPETVVSQYKKAFELITGQAFSPRLWARIFLLPRIHPVFLRAWADRPATVRKTEDAVRRPVPQSVLGEQGERILETESAVESETIWSDLLIDLDRLIDDGRTDEEIAEILSENRDYAIRPQDIAYYRARRAEISSIRPGNRRRASDRD